MAGGTGNLILKRGTTIPQDGQNSTSPSLLKGMPATQLVGLSHVVDTSGTTGGTLVYAYENYPNRLWVGMDAFGTTGQESGSGSGGGGGPGSLGGSGFSTQESSGAATRPIWFGAEIRADAAVYGDNGGSPPTTDTVPTILQADWANPSDYVLVTQKAIKSYVSSVSSGAVTILDVATAGKTGTLYPMMADGNGSGRNIYIDQTDTPFSYDTTTNTLTITGDLAVIGGDITTTSTGTATIFNTNATALNIGGGVTSGTINLGVGSTGSINIGATGTVRLGTSGTSGGTVEILSGSMTSGTKTINIGTNTGVGTTNVTIGSTSGTSTVALQGNATITGDLAVNGGDITTTSTGTATLFNANATTVNIGGGATTAVNIGNASGIVAVAGDLRVSGNDIQMNGGTTALTFSGSGDVAVNGDLTVTGNDIKMSGGTTALSFSGSGDVTAAKDVIIGAGNVIKFNAPTSGSISLVAKNTTDGSPYTLTLPADDGTSGQVLTTDGNGNLDWADTGIATSVGVSESNSGTYTLVLAQTGISGSNVSTSLVVDGSDGIQYDVNTDTLTVSGDLAVNGSTSADITTTTAAASLFDSTATTVNIAGGASTALNLGFDGTGGSTTNISVGEMTSAGHTKTINIGTTTASTTNGFVAVNIGSSHALQSLTTVIGNLSVTGNLTIDGTTTTVNTTTLIVEDKNIELGNVATPTDFTANNGGITILGDTNKTLLWNTTSIAGVGGVWRSSENFSVLDGRVYAVGDAAVLSKTYLKVYNSGTGSGSITIKSPATTSPTGIGDNSYTLPTTLGSANQVLTVSSVSGGNDAILSWVDQSSITAGSVTVRKEATGSTTKYPIPFFASNAQDNPTLTQSGNDFSSWSEAATKIGYLYSDYTSQSIDGGPTNKVAGLMYEVSDDGTSTVGTLYCDYIGATLDCGEY